MSKFVFYPTKNQIESSNIYKFMKKHNIDSLNELLKKSSDDLDWYWKAVDEDIGIVWDKKYDQVKDTSKGIPWTSWFVNGKTNIILSSIEKFSKLTPDKIAYHFISEDNIHDSITYNELNQHVNNFSNGLKSIGIKKGDVVAIYMPMIKEAASHLRRESLLKRFSDLIGRNSHSDSSSLMGFHKSRLSWAVLYELERRNL